MEVADPAEGSAGRNATGSIGHKAGRPKLRQVMFNWSAKKSELEKNEMDARNFFMTKL